MSLKSEKGNGLSLRLRKMVEKVPTIQTRRVYGILRECVGPLVRVTLANARIGDVCELIDPETNHKLLAEIVAVRDHDALLSPYGSAIGLSVQTQVFPTGEPLQIHVGEELLSRILDAFGKPLDGEALNETRLQTCCIRGEETNPMQRPLIDTTFPTGIRVIDAFNTIGAGQRVGLFGEAGAGKSQLLSMISHNAKFDVCVLGLIGERGREVREFLDRQLPEEARSKCVTVVSTSDRPPMERVTAAYTATTIAEYFRDQGYSVLLLIDSLTRYARALREVGLAIGEPPARRGFPASVFAELPKLIERSGRTDKGIITAIYAVLVEGDALGDPIVEEVRSLTDGHLILSMEKAQGGQYPAIDVLKSKSRVMDAIVPDSHQVAASHLRQLLEKYSEIELLLQVGEYSAGSDAIADEAIQKNESINSFLRQDVKECSDLTFTQEMLERLAIG